MKTTLILLLLLAHLIDLTRVLERQKDGKISFQDQETIDEATKVHQKLKEKDPSHDMSQKDDINPFEGIDRNPSKLFTEDEMNQIIQEKDNEMKNYFEKNQQENKQENKQTKFEKIQKFYKFLIILTFL